MSGCEVVNQVMISFLCDILCSPWLHSWIQQAHSSHCNRFLYITVHSTILPCNRSHATRRPIELQPWPKKQSCLDEDLSSNHIQSHILCASMHAQGLFLPPTFPQKYPLLALQRFR